MDDDVAEAYTESVGVDLTPAGLYGDSPSDSAFYDIVDNESFSIRVVEEAVVVNQGLCLSVCLPVMSVCCVCVRRGAFILIIFFDLLLRSSPILISLFFPLLSPSAPFLAAFGFSPESGVLVCFELYDLPPGGVQGTVTLDISASDGTATSGSFFSGGVRAARLC